MSLQWLADHFSLIQFSILAIVLIVAWNSFRSRQQSTSFRSREADRHDLNRLKGGEDFAHSKMKNPRPVQPLQLPGITLSGKPHEILGVDASANEAEIMRAYKDKIKMFHPDRIQGQARDQLKFYEDASAKINDAKEFMLAQLKKK